jgi:hypothetical protein
VSCVRRSVSGVRFAAEVSTLFVIPCGFIVAARRRVKSRVQAVLGKFETFLNDEGSVGVVDEIFFGDPVVLYGIADQAAEECNVGAGANLHEQIGGSGCARESRVDRNQLGVAVALGFHRPLETARMVFGGIAAHDQHHVGVLDVDPAICHGSASECWSQT